MDNPPAMPAPSLRPCRPDEADTILAIVNDAAAAYRGIIPADRWHEPYMSRDALLADIADGVRFWGAEAGAPEHGELVGVMGIQDRGDVALIRHAYVRTRARRGGIGSALLRHIEGLTTQPILIGTWAAAEWAIRFYEKHGFRRVGPSEKDTLLARYWRIPVRQMETSVVLASASYR
jgi:GNAT superfamily N-acetyltransferase